MCPELIPGQFHAELVATNPLNCPLALTNVRITADSDDLSTESLSEVILEPYESRIISLPMTATKPGTITIKSVKFDFHRFFPCEQPLARRGRRLHATKQQRVEPTYANDTSLNVEIQQARPVMSASLEGIPDVMYVGEQVGGTLVIRNEGKIAFEGVQLFVNELGSVRLAKGELTEDSGPNKADPKIRNITLNRSRTGYLGTNSSMYMQKRYRQESPPRYPSSSISPALAGLIFERY
jgi:hypothetical protein